VESFGTSDDGVRGLGVQGTVDDGRCSAYICCATIIRGEDERSRLLERITLNPKIMAGKHIIREIATLSMFESAGHGATTEEIWPSIRVET
jgi:hypothetical protein